jgi:hypothetical protein
MPTAAELRETARKAREEFEIILSRYGKGGDAGVEQLASTVTLIEPLKGEALLGEDTAELKRFLHNVKVRTPKDKPLEVSTHMDGEALELLRLLIQKDSPTESDYLQGLVTLIERQAMQSSRAGSYFEAIRERLPEFKIKGNLLTTLLRRNQQTNNIVELTVPDRATALDEFGPRALMVGLPAWLNRQVCAEYVAEATKSDERRDFMKSLLSSTTLFSKWLLGECCANLQSLENRLGGGMGLQDIALPGHPDEARWPELKSMKVSNEWPGFKKSHKVAANAAVPAPLKLKEKRKDRDYGSSSFSRPAAKKPRSQEKSVLSDAERAEQLKNLVCYNCDDKGHTARTCPKPCRHCGKKVEKGHNPFFCEKNAKAKKKDNKK